MNHRADADKRFVMKCENCKFRYATRETANVHAISIEYTPCMKCGVPTMVMWDYIWREK